MIRFTGLIAPGAPSADAFAAYEAEVGPSEAAAARALLSGTRPKRIASSDTLLGWVASATHTPAFLIQACLAATADKSEVASLLMPQATGCPPTLTETLGLLRAAPQMPDRHSVADTSPDAPQVLTDADRYLALARRLPPKARLILNRLATGTFRIRLAAPIATPQTPGLCLAILTLIDPAGPTASFALPHGNGLIPLCKLPLTLPETAEILNWARNHTTNRFGPLRELAPALIFEITFQGTTPNPRRKSGLDLVGAKLTQWHRSLTPDRATNLATLLDLQR